MLRGVVGLLDVVVEIEDIVLLFFDVGWVCLKVIFVFLIGFDVDGCCCVEGCVNNCDVVLNVKVGL